MPRSAWGYLSERIAVPFLQEVKSDKTTAPRTTGRGPRMSSEKCPKADRRTKRPSQYCNCVTDLEINAIATADMPINPIPHAYPANSTGAYCRQRCTPNFFSSE